MHRLVIAEDPTAVREMLAEVLAADGACDRVGPCGEARDERQDGRRPRTNRMRRPDIRDLARLTRRDLDRGLLDDARRG